eukprot:3758026-Rhodomonas_salina.1
MGSCVGAANRGTPREVPSVHEVWALLAHRGCGFTPFGKIAFATEVTRFSATALLAQSRRKAIAFVCQRSVKIGGRVVRAVAEVAALCTTFGARCRKFAARAESTLVVLAIEAGEAEPRVIASIPAGERTRVDFVNSRDCREVCGRVCLCERRAVGAGVDVEAICIGSRVLSGLARDAHEQAGYRTVLAKACFATASACLRIGTVAHAVCRNRLTNSVLVTTVLVLAAA